MPKGQKWPSFSADEPRRGHAVCTHQVHTTAPISPFLLKQNISPNDIAKSDIMKLKVS